MPVQAVTWGLESKNEEKKREMADTAYTGKKAHGPQGWHTQQGAQTIPTTEYKGNACKLHKGMPFWREI